MPPALARTGVARVLPTNTMNWSTATTWDSCSFTVSQVNFTSIHHYYPYNPASLAHIAGPVTRAGFTIDSGCRLTNSNFLPSLIFGAGRNGDGQLFQSNLGSRLWYPGVNANTNLLNSTVTIGGNYPCWNTYGGSMTFNSNKRSISYSFTPLSSYTATFAY